MLKRFLVAGILAICCLAVNAEELPLFINGVKVQLPSVPVGSTSYYPAEALAKAMGYSLLNSPSGYTLNGQVLKQPPLMLDGKPFTTLEAAAASVGGSVLRDPVRKLITVTCNASTSSQGLAYYSGDYKTPEQVKREEHQTMMNQSGNPGGASVDANWKDWAKLYPTTNAAVDRSQRGPYEVKMPSHPWMAEEDEPVAAPDSSPQNNVSMAAAIPTGASEPSGFLTKVADNGTYKVIITNVRVAEALKGAGVSPRAGCKFVVIYLTEENVSKEEQKTAWFALRDSAGGRYDATPSLSNFSGAPLRAHETTTGYIVCEVPVNAQPSALQLLCDPPLSVSLLL